MTPLVTKTNRCSIGVTLALVVTTQAACGALTREEAAEILDEVQLASQASALTTNTVEISTNFTLGAAASAAADEVRTFIESQLPCALVTVAGSTLTIEYGAQPGNCVYRGNTFSGSHAIQVVSTAMNAVEVSHSWTDMSNGIVELDGSATVTWDFAGGTRSVTHNSTWTRLSDGRLGQGTGNRVQMPLTGGIFEGFSVDGLRTWSGQAGDWDLDIDNVEMRWVDPVPQAGTYTVDTPFDAEVSMSFVRTNPTTINVTLEGPSRSFDFDVITLP